MKALPIYQEQMQILASLPDENMAHIVKAMFAYAQDADDVPELDVWEKAVFDSFKVSIDKSKARADAGAKGGSKPAEVEAAPEANESKPQANESKPEARNKEQEISKKEQARSKNDSLSSRSAPARASDFESLWDLYPRKEGKKAAFEAFKRAIKDGVTVDEMRSGILRYSDYIKVRNVEPRYIAQGSTYFSQRRWQDEYDFTPSHGYSERGDDMSWALMDM